MQKGSKQNDRIVALWLYSGCFMLAVILIVGGLTRLNQAGLSITEWEVIGGVIPPVNSGQWQSAFDQYRQFPEYQQLNKGMSLVDFKYIYWWEYSHRLLGRILGLLFVIPFIIFLWKRKINLNLASKVSGIFILGGLQGLLGWYMVQSGLMGEPYVSHLRLTLHLGLAVLIFGLLFRLALSTWYENETKIVSQTIPHYLRTMVLILIALVFIQILYGGLVAGLKAGFVYNTFPRMGAYWIPLEIGSFGPWWSDVVNNSVTVQFIHRMLAYSLSILVFWIWLTIKRMNVNPKVTFASHLLLALIIIQITVGVSVLLTYVPVWLSALHQSLALLVFSAALWVEKLMQKEPGEFETQVLHKKDNSKEFA
ncbi:MAG: COX15/CtaA family protein [Balneolales bacterium]